jgi:ATP-binding cassette subfamily D (ALD) protein 4
MAQDIENFSEKLRLICEEIIITPVLIVYYTYKIWSLSGYLGPLLIYIYFVVGVISIIKQILYSTYSKFSIYERISRRKFQISSC